MQVDGGPAAVQNAARAGSPASLDDVAVCGLPPGDATEQAQEPAVLLALRHVQAVLSTRPETHEVACGEAASLLEQISL